MNRAQPLQATFQMGQHVGRRFDETGLAAGGGHQRVEETVIPVRAKTEGREADAARGGALGQPQAVGGVTVGVPVG